MKYRKIFVFMLMIVVMTTVYGQERYRAKPASTQLSIYSLPPLERAISCIKFYESWHGEKKHWPYVGWGHKVLPRERFTNNITKAQGDSILRADMMKFCRLFSKFGRDSVILACLAYQVGAFRLLGSKNLPKSKLIQKLEAGDRNIYKEYTSFRCYRGKVVQSIERRRKAEFMLLFEE
ncbi:glycoside hydrolase [Bacteroides stercoris]|nr:glycoside hydrolase [Bacteroides stercoris]